MSELDFLSTLYSLNGDHKIDEALDHVFLWVNDRFEAGDFDMVDSMLAMIDPTCFGEDMIVGLITSMFPSRDQLPQYEDFVSRCHYQLTAVVGPVTASEIYEDLSIRLGVQGGDGTIPRQG